MSLVIAAEKPPGDLVGLAGRGMDPPATRRPESCPVTRDRARAGREAPATAPRDLSAGEPPSDAT